MKFMTHYMVLGNMCAKYEGNRLRGYEVMLRTRCDRQTHRHAAIIELPAAAKNTPRFAEGRIFLWPVATFL